MKPKQIVASYFLLQALSTVTWWMVLIVYPTTVRFFQPYEWPAETLLSFWLGDVVLVVGGSLFVSLAVAMELRCAAIAVWSLAGAVWYPTLYCIAVSVCTGQAWISAAMMAAMAGLTLAMATIHGTADQQAATFRATRLSKTASLLWTFGQLVIFWGTFLWVLPMAVFELEQMIPLPTFSHPGQAVVSRSLLCVASMLGFWSAWTMATIGDGTPLPTASAPTLVVSGPYRFVRNPMALAGILQGLAVGWYMGSIGIIAYAVLGGFVWHLLVRPFEERDLLARFGDSFRQYRATTGLWWPSSPNRFGTSQRHSE